eukprot:Colp12_sorted_trinity150504_noHs@4475
MPRDYYKTLSVNRDASDDEIKKSFRLLALKHHPERSKEANAEAKFKEIAEAYDVLSDHARRSVYNQYGEAGLKQGIPGNNGETGIPGYTFHGNADQIFKDFFGDANPFSDFFGETNASAKGGVSFSGIPGMAGMTARGIQPQDPPLEREIALTLEELYMGTTKKMKVSKRVMNPDGQTSTVKDRILTIDIRPGWRAGTKITFPKEGDQGPNNIPADIVFIVTEKKHERFQRHGNDLIHTTQIPLARALTGTVIDLQTLDGRTLNIPVNDIVSPSYVKVVAGEGMPHSKNNKQKGNLIIKFEVVFPTTLGTKSKDLIKEAFGIKDK